jgi:uncharacterized membrane protein
MTNMTESKPWYASMGVVGGAIAGASAIFGFFGVTIDAETQRVIASEAVALVTAAGTVIGSALAIWGRIRAVKRIG